MANRILLATILANLLFLGSGILMLVFSLLLRTKQTSNPTNGEDAILHLIFQRFPLVSGIINAVLIIVTFVLTLPGLLQSTSRGWLKLSSYLVVFCGLYTMILGLYIWIMTLKTGEDFANIYIDQPWEVQAMVQTSFGCCGYFNSTSPAFITNPTCPSPAAAAVLRGCKMAISTFANVEIDSVFTAMFAIVGVDALFILSIACLHKDRKEKENYRRIDAKMSSWKG